MLRQRRELAGRQLLGPGVGRQPEILEAVANRVAHSRAGMLERARQRLAPVGERLADQLAELGRAPGRGAFERDQRRADTGPRRNTAGSTVRSRRTSQASCTSTLGEP